MKRFLTWYFAKAFYAGVVGAVTMSVLMVLSRRVGWTTLNLEMMLGSFFTRNIGGGTWLLGLWIHLTAGGLFALIYFFGFRKIYAANAKVGACFGVLHAFLSGILMGYFHFFHPLMPEVIIPPGFFAIHYGKITALAFVILHVLYGAIVGNLSGRLRKSTEIYHLYRQRDRLRRAA